MPNTWITDYTISGVHFWKCGCCQNLVPYSVNNMNYCGHCGEIKYYQTTEKELANKRRECG